MMNSRPLRIAPTISIKAQRPTTTGTTIMLQIENHAAD
jgi:hypothetical protein